MPPLLQTQQNDIRRVIEDATFRFRDFRVFANEVHPRIECGLAAPEWVFQFQGGDPSRLQVRYCPGDNAHEATNGFFPFETAVSYIPLWLRNIRRELAAQQIVGVEEEPAWLTEEMPKTYRERANEIGRLTLENEKLRRFGQLLWQTGEPLNEAVRDLFIALGHGATLTERGATYDVTGDLGESRRLLIEVTGIEGPIQKKSPKLSQVFQTTQEIATETDRVVLAANTFRQLATKDRLQTDSVTPDALKLIRRMGANFVTGVTLFDLWTLSLDDEEKAVKQVARLCTQDGGIFSLDAP
jgi:hypothetical protein